ncbi:MAG: anti-sigma F factor [Clostridia bacterium]|nr:anti-sigma F factor [Clostridia bacterium]
MDTNKFTLKIPSRSCNESFARVTVAAFATVLDPTLEEISDIKTSVSEAVTNCNVHAYPNSIGDIYISCEILKGNVLKIKIRDKGCGIEDVDKARQPLFTTGGEERAGLGFAVMESMMDTVRVTSKCGKGTTVTMKKKISCKDDAR